jgi:hypothetical protein
MPSTPSGFRAPPSLFPVRAGHRSAGLLNRACGTARRDRQVPLYQVALYFGTEAG